MAINKIEYGNEVLIDLSHDTVSPENLQAGAVAHSRSGQIIRGSATYGGVAPCTVLLAPAFDASVNYKVGDYVIRNGSLYRFVVDHDAGEWNSNHVKETNATNSIKNNETITVAKNLLPYTYDEGTHESNGITFTVNEDGTIKINGTATKTTYFNIIKSENISSHPIKAGVYTLSGGYSNPDVILYMQTSESPNTNFLYKTVPITKTIGDTTFRVNITVNNGTTVDNLLVKPMLEEGQIAHEYRMAIPEAVLDDTKGLGDKKYFLSADAIAKRTLERKGMLADNTDLDSVYSPGFYLKVGSRTVSNAPSMFEANDAFMLIVIYAPKIESDSTKDYVYQFIVPEKTERSIYWREHSSSAGWKDWTSNEDIYSVAENLLPYKYDEQEQTHKTNGITFTVNEDGSITVDGTATADAYFNIIKSENISSHPIKAGVYTLSGGYSNPDVILYMQTSESPATNFLYKNAPITKAVGDTNFRVNITVNNGTTVDNLLVKPMLEEGRIAHKYRRPMPEAILDDTKGQGDTNFFWSAEKLDRVITQPKGVLADNTDLDNLVSIGMYIKYGSTTLVNIPPNSSPSERANIVVLSGKKVRPVAGNVDVCQIYITPNRIFHRYIASEGKWGNWINDTSYQRVITEDYCNLTKCLNQIKRSWSPKYSTMINIDHLSTEKGTPSTYKYYQQGKEYNEIPYSRVLEVGGDVFFDRNLATYFSAIENPASIVYQEQLYTGRFQGNNYGGVCTSFVEWLLGHDIYRGVKEIKDYIDFYDYHGPEDIEIGDVLITEGDEEDVYSHIQIVAGIDIDADNFQLGRILVAEQGRTKIRAYEVSEFEERFGPGNAELYKIGRIRNTKIRSIKPVRFATDVIADMGNNTHYYLNDEVWLYIPSGDTLHYKEENASDWSSVALSSLDSDTVNGVTVYDVTSLMAVPGKYYFTTNKNNHQYCELLRVNVGTVSVDAETSTVTLSGYSSNIEPLYYQIYRFRPFRDGEQPPDSTVIRHPDDLYSVLTNGSQRYIESDSFQVTPEIIWIFEGYFIRVYYKHEFGRAFCDSDFIFVK